MASWLRQSFERTFLHNPLGDRIRRGGGPARLRDVMNRYITGETRQIKRARQARALAETVEFIEANLSQARSHDSAFDVLRDGVRAAAAVPGLYLEFGVRGGFTINWIARQTSQTVYGFDSFEGLPEDWTSEHRRGAFRVKGLPSVRENVSLVRGLFDQSIPQFLLEHPEPLAFMHIDSDLYSSAVTVLNLFAKRIQPGTVIVFDEFFNYPGWKDGEYKAFMEFISAHPAKFEYIGYCHFGEQVALRLTAIA